MDQPLAVRKSLINHFFPDSAETERTTMLDRLLTSKTKSSPCNPKMLHHVCDVLKGDDDEKQFTDLRNEVADAWRQEFILMRTGRTKEKAGAITPEPIKLLRPPLPGIYLVWQFATKQFEAYYPKPRNMDAKTKKGTKRRTHWSTSKTNGAKFTQLQPLTHCCKFLWSHHKKNGGDIWLN